MNDLTTSQIIDRLSESTGADADVIEAVAAACGRYLVELHEGDEAAARGLLHSEPHNAVDIALANRIQTINKLRVEAHNRPMDMAHLVYRILTTEEPA